MEPKNNKKNPFESIFFSFSLPSNFHIPKQESLEEVIARLDEVNETVDAMTAYPQAKKMLDKLYGKL